MYHIIHILNHASYLSIDRGCLVCSSPAKPQRRAVLEDILAVIVAARGVSFSADCLSALISNNSIVLHCDRNYKPIGRTAGLHRVVHNEVLDMQTLQDISFCKELWSRIIFAKIKNQAHVLDYISAKHKLWNYINAGKLDEGNAARHYWKYFFKNFKKLSPAVRITKGACDPVNGMLNYGYAVISAFCHRLLLVHGLNTSIGIYHKYRFRSDPLVYDIMEPLRPFCDLILYRFSKSNTCKNIREWTKFAASDIISLKINVAGFKNISFNIALDKYINSVANCFRTKSLDNLYIPQVTDVNIK
jgi:CRISPR-associated protein Cas1